MHLTRAADYGVRVLIHLADVESNTRASLTDLAKVAEVTPAFLSKVLQRLVQAGLVASKRGKRGGFELLPGGRSATLLDILLALDGVPELNICLGARQLSPQRPGARRTRSGRRRRTGCGKSSPRSRSNSLAARSRAGDIPMVAS